MDHAIEILRDQFKSTFATESLQDLTIDYEALHDILSKWMLQMLSTPSERPSSRVRHHSEATSFCDEVIAMSEEGNRSLRESELLNKISELTDENRSLTHLIGDLKEQIRNCEDMNMQLNNEYKAQNEYVVSLQRVVDANRARLDEHEELKLSYELIEVRNSSLEASLKVAVGEKRCLINDIKISGEKVSIFW